jgi:hypothetical protein
MTRSELWDLLDSPLDKTNGTPIGRKRDCAFSVKQAVDKTHWTPLYVFVQKYNFRGQGQLHHLFNENRHQLIHSVIELCFNILLASMSGPYLSYFHLEMLWSV